MRIAISGLNRVGITQEVLALLARRGLDLRAVEVEIGHIYLDAPALAATELEPLCRELLTVPGIRGVEPVTLLPGERRRQQLDILLDAMADPVLAVDGDGRLLAANRALLQVVGRESIAPGSLGLDDLCDDAPALLGELRANRFRLARRELTLAGQPFLAEAQPMRDDAVPDAPVGAMLLLHSPRRLGQHLSALQSVEDDAFQAIVGESVVIARLKERARRLAAVDAPLLILGETGTGKELLARACHQVSRRRDAPFLALNCAALPESLAESELFGYAPGAFSGARKGGKPGLFELAEGGTLFLDEIGEMSPYLQAKLLRFLQDGRLRRVGGEREIRVDVRIVSATHRDLEALVAEGRFREDLYYRLNVLSLQA
ncbi:MAG TPA: sigma 54-interacting transcriptional regulator, partial [Candidatus Competibacteraceae bacterium]|nr:sigma 54-interacting transcriptional regulator [Candidatus Competibacteraceae bacterium]